MARSSSVFVLCATVGVVLGLASTPAHPQTPEVVISRNHVRVQGTPVTVTDSFTVCDPGGQFTLTVDNGPGGEPRVSSGTIEVNGIEVIHEADFNQQVAHIERPLTNIVASNQLAVRLGSQPDGTIQVTVLGLQSCGVRITAPSPGATLTGPEVVVQGTVPAGAGSDVAVTVNDTVAFVSGGRFVTRVAVDPQVMTLRATATNSQGVTLSTDSIPVTVQAQGAETSVLLQVAPVAGLAPLTVSVRVTSLVPVSQITLDLNGTGGVDFQGPTLDGQAFTYPQPGLYVPTVRVTDGSGAIHTATATVQVYDPVVLDSFLQQKWGAMRNALRVGDIPGALGQIALRARPKYDEAFQLIPAQLATIDAILPGTLTLVQVWGPTAIYEATRTDDGVVQSFEVRFALDDDGIWRIAGF